MSVPPSCSPERVVVERLAYDSRGKRRHLNGADDPAGSLVSQATRGYTGHEMLADVGLVHMNGRVYDPYVARVTSADIYVVDPADSQSWNRYSYVANRPLNHTDPSGWETTMLPPLVVQASPDWWDPDKEASAPTAMPLPETIPSTTHASKCGKRYRYYVSHRLKMGGSSKESGWRVAAHELERIVLRQAQELLTDQATLAGWLKDHASVTEVERAFTIAEEMATSLQAGLASEQRKNILHAIFQQIVLSAGVIRFVVKKRALVHQLLSGLGRPPNDQASPMHDGAEVETFVIERRIAIKRRGVEARIIINGAADCEPDPSLVELIAKAHYYLARLCDGSVSSIVELGNELSVHRADISRILPLAFLSPAITGAILAGRPQIEVTARALSRLVDVPPSWNDQAAALGM